MLTKDDFFSRYGKNTKAKARYNRAIRAECPGGHELLDLLELVSSMRSRTQTTDEAQKLLTIEDRLQVIKDRMVCHIQDTYSLVDIAALLPHKEAGTEQFCTCGEGKRKLYTNICIICGKDIPAPEERGEEGDNPERQQGGPHA